MFTKIGESLEITGIEDATSSIPMVAEDVLERFTKFANGLKKIAPKADDFLYFSAVMMHSAESSAINDDGTPKLTASGVPVKVGWDTSGDTWRWTTNDNSIRPYANANHDSFPESELIKAHKKWIGKPLCIDHKSSSVDHVRGFIVDTYYDRNLKRVVALCALDKKNYPDLAFKVTSGYSTCVSMGVAVGRAICSDCAKVARAESDFCEHMRRKSSYAEINVDLNPLELSIVVNGADPKAHIKHIIAAANTMNSYLDTRSKELNKLASTYSATIHRHDSDSGSDVFSAPSVQVEGNDLESFKSDIERGLKELESFNSKLSEKNTTNEVYNQSSGSLTMDEGSPASVNSAMAPPHNRLASADFGIDSLSDLKKVTGAIEATLNQMKETLDKLTIIATNKEENMSGKDNMNKKAYFQGTEEPTPGQPKYTKDPLNDKLRTDGDKHMEGQMDTGPVDGMHPGVDSAGVGELERKKMLARATAEERALRRTAIVDLAKKALDTKKEAYFQGGGGVNEPTPHKTKYPADKMNEDLREDGDKQMVGQKPFPGVGPVGGLHPSPASADTADELKRKELLRRADALRARFVKAHKEDGSDDMGNSAWQVFAGEKLLLSASVDELTNGRTDMLFDSVATKEFGAKLISTIKVQGANKVRAMFKKAQDVGLPAPDAVPAPAVESAPEAPVEDEGKSGDPKEVARDLAVKAVETTTDLKEAVDALTGYQAQMGDLGGAAEMGAAASFGASTLNKLGSEINVALTDAMKEAITDLKDHEQELHMIVAMYEKGSVNDANKDMIETVVNDALAEAKTAIAHGFKLMSAFVKYARGTQAIVKRAKIEAELTKMANDTSDDVDSSDADDALVSLVDDNALDLDSEVLGDEEEHSHDELGDDVDLAELAKLEGLLADDNDANVELSKGAPMPSGLTDKDTVHVVASLDTKDGRTALRAKLAADALKVSPHLHEAHPKGGFTTQLDVKPEGDLAKVEDIEEIHDKMMDVATAPVKVRKEAEVINRLISEGKLDPTELDALVAEGLDKDAVSYWKKFYGQVDGGGEFASELVREHVKAQMEDQLNSFKVKIARAYELAYDMSDRGLCHNDRVAVSAQVEEIMKLNDDGFDTLKRVVARHSPNMRKDAGRMPQVGVREPVENVSHTEESLRDQLSAAFSTSARKTF